MKRLEAWAVVSSANGYTAFHRIETTARLELREFPPGSTVIRLVPYDSRKEAVVRAAKRFTQTLSDKAEQLAKLDLIEAIAKLNRPRGKK